MTEPLLEELGVVAGVLSEEERQTLHRDGFLNLGQLLSEENLEVIRTETDRLLAREGKRAGEELKASPNIRHPAEAGVDRLADLVNKGAAFDRFYTHPRVLAAAAAVLGDEFKLSSLNYRSAQPGSGQQQLHVDWRHAVREDEYLVCNSIWLLDEFTPENGATRLVPGSHRIGRLPQDELEDPWAEHPSQILLTASAGTVIVFNAHVWHGGTRNNTDMPRRAIHSYFCRIDQTQQLDQRELLRPETRQRLSAAALRLLTG